MIMGGGLGEIRVLYTSEIIRKETKQNKTQAKEQRNIIDPKSSILPKKAKSPKSCTANHNFTRLESHSKGKTIRGKRKKWKRRMHAFVRLCICTYVYVCNGE